GTVLIQRDAGHLELVAFHHGLDLLGRLLEVDGDELDVLLIELPCGLLDLGHGLDARAAPGRPEVEDDDLALAVGQAEPMPVHQLEVEIGGRLADERRLGTGCAAPAAGAVVDGLDRLGGILELPPPVLEVRGRLLDAVADEELVDLADAHAGLAEHLALARERIADEMSRRERDADAVVADGLYA